MPVLATRAVEVSVPATSANLGPGYDALGLALEHRDLLRAEVAPTGLEIVVEGEGAGQVPRDERHLVHRAMTRTFEALGVTCPGLRLTCHNVIPHGRGLGSSSAAIVGGVVLARALVDGGSQLLDDPAALALAAEIEGHPDNVAPALLGGLTIAVAGEAGTTAVRLDVDPRVGVVVFVAPDPVETVVARGLLPDVVPHRDAAADAGRSALLVAAMTGHPELLWEATRDWLHQDYREPAMPATLALVRTLRADGVPAVVSGAGPSVLALVAGEREREQLVRRAPDGWRVLTPAPAVRGATVG